MTNLQEEMAKYMESMKYFLPVEEKIIDLKKSGKSSSEIKKELGSENNIFEYVPDILYHGSTKDIDVLKVQESTQKGCYVYATDNPIHALFFSIFRNSSEARSHIEEYIDEEGNYQVKYLIDERIKDALKNIIVDDIVFIYVCDGRKFFKPQGATFIRREWASKENIVPLDKIKVNIKEFFKDLEKNNLVEYSYYDKSKDWKTIIDLLGQNYPFGLETERAKDIEKYDTLYDNFIMKNFKEQFAFSKKFREFAKKIMDPKFKLNDTSNKNKSDAKIKYIKETADSFLLAKKDEKGNVIYNINQKKLDEFLKK